MMKTIQAVARYLPDNCGGIQIRLSELLPVLRTYGIDSTVAAASSNSQEDFYHYAGTEIYRYPISSTPRLEPNHGEVPHGGFERFARWLKAQRADLYHQHQWNPRCGLPHLRLAKELGMTTVVSIRLPEAICQRQTLMLNGQEACDGKIDEVRCSRCCDNLTANLPEPVIRNLSRLPISVLSRLPLPQSAHLATSSGSAGSVVRPLVVPAYIAARRQGLLEMAKFADRIVTLSERLYEMLLINGIPEDKLVICRTGIPDSFPKPSSQAQARTGPLRIGFLGRWNPTKGIHILVDAVRALPAEIPIELVIHAVPDSKPYEHRLLAEIEQEPRIRVASKLAREEVPAAMAGFDVFALPAQWFDVRPMVVLEAHASGVPVLGSNMGGIPELIRHGVDGLLLPPTDVQAWTDALARLATDPILLAELRAGIKPLRTMSEEAADTAELYQSLVTQSTLSVGAGR